MDFAVEVDAAPDSAFWFLCLVHPSMRMRVHVVANAAEASDQAVIDEATAEQLANDHDDALALHNSLKNRLSFHKVGGKKVWDAWSGFDTKRFSLLDMYPHKLTVDKGDKVTWHFGQLQNEVHTVSLPKANALDQIVNQDFMFSCDPDGDAGPGPDNPPDQEGFPFCSDPAQMEVDTADLLFPAFGNGGWTAAADLEHSGVRGAIPLAPSDAFYTLKMNNETGKKGIPYICAIHSFMEGHVRVK